jgi:hypothetical protein
MPSEVVYFVVSRSFSAEIGPKTAEKEDIKTTIDKMWDPGGEKTPEKQ